MLAYILRRLVLLVPTLLGVLAVVFFVMAFAPGGFGGQALTAEGAQAEGKDAARARKQMARRYGYDLPKVAQFGRWLNQISPVGFRMSSDVVFDDPTRAAVADVFDDLPLNTRPANLERAVDLALTMAAYHAQPPVEVARMFAERLEAPHEALDLFEWMNAQPDAGTLEQLDARLRQLLDQEEGLARAQNMLVEELSFEASGVARVRFDLPAIKTPDFGRSLKGRRVIDLLLERIPVTVLLNALTIPIVYTIAIVSGLYAARHRGTVIDYGTGALFVGLWSLPVIWVGVMAIHYLANQENLRWFPTGGMHALRADQMAFLPGWGADGFERGWLLDTLWHLALPVACLSYGGFAVMSKVMRGSILDALSSDYVRTARAKGVPERAVLWRHTFRNALLPLITMVSGILPALFAGTIVIETLFSLNGLGKLGVEAAFEKDREVVMATTLFAGLLGLLSELIRDLCYAIADPRVSYE